MKSLQEIRNSINEGTGVKILKIDFDNEITGNDIVFGESGEIIVKNGNKIYAKLYHKPTFYAINKIKSTFDKENPYSVSLTSPNINKVVSNLDDIAEIINKYIINK